MYKKLLCSVVLGLTALSSAAAPNQMGASIYSENDAFMQNYAHELKNLADVSDIKLVLNYSHEDIVKEYQQLQLAVKGGAGALIVNPVEPGSVHNIIQLAYDNGNLPIIFINREPSESALNSYQKAWYVGTDAGQSGSYQSEIITKYCLDHPDTDRNGDGKISYFLLQGQANLEDTVYRTMALRRSFEASPVSFKEEGAVYADWMFDKAVNATEQFIRQHGIDKVEAILANNDEMALGALQYLKRLGYNAGDPEKFIPVVGIDGSEQALKAVNSGEMIGTVKNDYATQALIAFKIAYLSLKGTPINYKSLGYYLVNDKRVFVPYLKITSQR